MKRVFHSLLLAAGALLLGGGCTPWRDYLENGLKVGPNYRQPKSAAAGSWIDATDERISTAEPADSAWWKVFGDPILEDLICSAYRQNLGLKEASFRILAARSQLAYAMGSLLPQTQDVNFSYLRANISRNIPNADLFGVVPGTQRYFDIYDLGFNLGWEIDLWGRIRRNIEADKARFDASIEEYDAVLVTLVADVAQAYTQIRTLQSQITTTQKNVDIQGATVDLVQERFDEGVVTTLDVSQAKLNLADTKALLPALKLRLRQANNRLCTLLSIPMEDLDGRIGTGPIPSAGREVAVGIPAALIRRRPDIRSLERQLVATNARRGIATAELYPSLGIFGSAGFAAESFGEVFEGSSWLGVWGPTFRWNILNYGRLRNRIRYADAKFDEMANAYLDKVIQANAEAEDALKKFLQSQDVAMHLEDAEKAAKQAVDTSRIQYEEGAIDYIRVFLAERELTSQQNAVARARGDIADGLINTFRALGGGWQLRLVGSSSNGEETLGPIPVAEAVPALEGQLLLPDADPVEVVQKPAAAAATTVPSAPADELPNPVPVDEEVKP